MSKHEELSGRELDALVAEKIFGAKVRSGQDPSFLTPRTLVEVWVDRPPGIYPTTVGMDGRSGWTECSPFSTEIASAWAVRAKMESLGWISEDRITYFGWSTEKAHPYGYSIWFEKWPERHEPDAGVPRKFHSHVRDFNNAPRAICLAALSALTKLESTKPSEKP